MSESVTSPYGLIPSYFKISRLIDICVDKIGVQTGPFGSQLHQRDYVANGTPIITVEHLGENRILHKEIPLVTDSDRERLSRYSLKKGDIVFSRVGSVDLRSLVREEEDGWLFSGRLLRVRPKSQIIDPGYLSWFFGLRTFREYIRKIAYGATMPSLNTALLSNVPIYYPPLSEQRAIAHILGTLDDKIELNRRTNETLEAIARALFKSWFVDFDPVRAKAAGRAPQGMDIATAALFPDAFEDSALGEVPRGWNVGVMSDLVMHTFGGDWGKDVPEANEDNAVFCIRGADIPSLQTAGLGAMPLRYIKQTSVTKRALCNGDLVVEISGGSPTQSTGRVVLVDKDLLSRLDHPLICSNFCRLVRLLPEYSFFVYHWLRYLYTNDSFLLYENGTTGIKNFAFTLFCNIHPMVLPPLPVLKSFNNLVTPLIRMGQSLGGESQTLTSLCDTLLPKLINGELKVTLQ